MCFYSFSAALLYTYTRLDTFFTRVTSNAIFDTRQHWPSEVVQATKLENMWQLFFEIETYTAIHFGTYTYTRELGTCRREQSILFWSDKRQRGGEPETYSLLAKRHQDDVAWLGKPTQRDRAIQ